MVHADPSSLYLTFGVLLVVAAVVLYRQLQQGYTYELTYTTEGGLLELQHVKEISGIIVPTD